LVSIEQSFGSTPEEANKTDAAVVTKQKAKKKPATKQVPDKKKPSTTKVSFQKIPEGK
jgi:hypothetical protein